MKMKIFYCFILLYITSSIDFKTVSNKFIADEDVKEVHVVFSNHFDAGCKIRGGDYISRQGASDPYAFQVAKTF